jgi:single-strand selective monofunctional uracil DNA glycosylase
MAANDLKKDSEDVAHSVSEDIAEKFIEIEQEFLARLSILKTTSFRTKAGGDNGVEYIYNPLEYASDLHNQYIRKYCKTPKKIVFLGMNPGPFGMVQTGVRMTQDVKRSRLLR